MSMNMRKIRNSLHGIFNSSLKTMDSSTSKSETSGKVYLLVFISSFFSHWSINTQAVRNQSSKRKYLLELIKRKPKCFKGIHHEDAV